MESATPNRLGGDDRGREGVSSALTPDEIRQRRLSALDKATTVPTIIVGYQKEADSSANGGCSNIVVAPDDADELDEELQAALALSLQDATAETNSVTKAATTMDSMASQEQQPRSFPNDEIHVAMTDVPSTSLLSSETVDAVKVLNSVYATCQPLDNILLYHKLLWDDQFTSDSDKERWLSQGIDVRNSPNDCSIATVSAENHIENVNNDGIWPTSLEAIAARHSVWGLVQHHGGPCGVLAAIQAELLRTLLFTEGGDVIEETHSMDKSYSIPVRVALARAIAVVLARAAITPSDVGEAEEHSNVVRIVLPSAAESRELTWQDLEPWHHAPNCLGSSNTLTVYSFPEFASTESSEVQTESAIGTSKRQKVVLDSENSASLSTNHLPSRISRIQRIAHVVEEFLLNDAPGKMSMMPTSPLEFFRRKGGVVLLVLSIVASRTIPIIQGEFDDPLGTRLTGQFGHCSQELMNLLLTGQAVSNVFDNTLSPSGDMVCRGIQSRPAIGYLTQLESMRYCEVGGYYKMPLYPIWVVGSQSHFTVLFGDLASLKESKSDMLLDECRRAFKSVEGGEENGFIQTDQLPIVLKRLNIRIGGVDDSDESARTQTLAAALEVTGASIILWDDFWKAASRLLTGASLEAVLHSGNDVDVSSSVIVEGSDQPPPLLTNFAANSDHQVKPEARRPTAVSANASHVESDEEMARRLAVEWDNEGVSGMMALSNAAEVHNSGLRNISMEIDQPSGSMGDEELARYLQEQYDSENAADTAFSGDGASIAAMSGSPFPMLSDIDESNSVPATPTHTLFSDVDEDVKPAAKLSKSSESLPFEQYGDSFSLYHYNGLRGGVLTPFRITRLTAEEAVGASIALNKATGASSHGSNGSQDLEDVVRTKWPSCSINWLGKTPPFID